MVDSDFYFVALFPGSSIATLSVMTTDATTTEITPHGGAQLVPIPVNYAVAENRANNIIEWFNMLDCTAFVTCSWRKLPFVICLK